MAIRYASATFTGTAPLLLNNPQTVDRFNPYAKAMAKINKKGQKRTDDDYLEARRLEMNSKVYWDDDLGIYAPASWLYAAIPFNSFAVIKVGKDKLRGGLFIPLGKEKCKLSYEGMEKVKCVKDVTENEKFIYTRCVKQQAIRITKCIPIFHKWSFTAELEFDDEVVDVDGMTQILNHVATRGGMGDFRPTFGRSEVEVTCV